MERRKCEIRSSRMPVDSWVPVSFCLSVCRFQEQEDFARCKKLTQKDIDRFLKARYDKIDLGGVFD